VKRLACLVLLCIVLPCGALAQTSGFDASAAASVWSAALSYIAPRALAPLSIPQMTIWGLNGLAALDPDLAARLQDNEIRLYGPDRVLAAIPAPAPDDARGWGAAAAQIAAAAYAASPALRQAGTQGLISSFFDELFNHFDPYSRYEPPAQAAQDQLMITGLAGTGLTLGQSATQVVVADVAADSPAQNAGIEPGTVVLRVNGAPVRPASVKTLNAEMDGLQGTSMTLRLADAEDAAGVLDVSLTRALIPTQTVIAEAAPAGLLAVKITGFNQGTSDQFSSALAASFAQGARPDGLIIDLRGNRGGVLRQAVLVADSLLPAGLITSSTGRDRDADQSYAAEGADLTGGADIAVLVDGQTASAAEILAAALADNRRAVVIGSETLGKGLVQTLTSLPDGGELYITWSRVLAPRGWPLQTAGLMPQICTSLGGAAVADQLRALAAGRNLMAPVLAAARAIRTDTKVDDILNVRDQCPADTGSDLDMSTAAAVLHDAALYHAALMPPAHQAS
jgi:carboxyl-terminal processing protease